MAQDLVPGRRKLVPAGAYKAVRQLLAAGGRECDAARLLQMSPATFSRAKDRDAKLRETVEAGQADFHAQLMRDLMDPERILHECDEQGLSVQQGTAILKSRFLRSLFLLKSRFGYVEGAPQSDDKAPSVIINLPGALDPASYAKAVSVQPAKLEAGSHD